MHEMKKKKKNTPFHFPQTNKNPRLERSISCRNKRQNKIISRLTGVEHYAKQLHYGEVLLPLLFLPLPSTSQIP